MMQIAGVRVHQVIAGETMIIWNDVLERYVYPPPLTNNTVKGKLCYRS